MANAMLNADFPSSHPDLLSLNLQPTKVALVPSHEGQQSREEARQDTEIIVSSSLQQFVGGTSTSNSNIRRGSDSLGMGLAVVQAAGDDAMKRAAMGAAPFYKNTNARKSVEFAILPPPLKRSRSSAVQHVESHGTASTTKQIVHALCVSITPSERLEAIRNARDTFDHNNQSVHDEEMANGADATLTKHLTFLMQQQSQQRQEGSSGSGGTNFDALASPATAAHCTDDMFRTELALTCDALESLFRASSAAVGVSFRRLGGILLRFLGRLLNDELQRRQSVATATCIDSTPLPTDMSPYQANNESTMARSDMPTRSEGEPTADGDVLLRNLTKLLGHFARVGEATYPMAHYPGLLGNLVALVSHYPYSSIPWEARLSALWTIANLACNPDNMQLMACVPGLLPTLVKIANRPPQTSDSLETSMEVLRSRSIASRAILNLSWSPENKVLLAGHSWVVDLLTELLIFRSAPKSLIKSSTVQEILDTTRSHVAGALRNLAAAPRRVKIALCSYKNGRLLDVLTDAALNDHDGRVRDRAFATIHNLAVQDTAQTMVNHPALVLAIKDVLLSTSDGNDDDDREQHRDGSPREHASATLLVLERSIQPSMDSYENLLDLLESLRPSTGDDSVSSPAPPPRSYNTGERIMQTEAV